MFNLGFGKKDDPALVIDVGNGSVGVSLFTYQPETGKNHIFYSKRKYVDPTKEYSKTVRFLDLTLKTLHQLLSEMHDSVEVKPERVSFNLSAPWYFAQTRNVVIDRKTPFVFNKKVYTQALEKELQIFRRDKVQKYFDPNEARVLEARNLQTYLNDYPTGKPFGKKINKAKLSTFFSVSSGKVMEKLEDSLLKFYHPKSVNFHSSAFLFFDTLQDIFTESKSFLVVEIGGEVTEVSVVKDGVLSHSSSFPQALNFLLRKTASVLKTSSAEAESLLQLYVDNKLDSDQNSKVQRVVEQVKDEWKKQLQESVLKLSSGEQLPHQVFLIAPKDAWFFKSAIEVEEFSQYEMTNKKFTVTSVDEKLLKDLFVFEKDSKDVLLMLEVLFFSKYSLR